MAASVRQAVAEVLETSASVMTRMLPELMRLLRALPADDRGQDLVEYALLTGAIGLTAAATWPLIVDALGNAYQAVDAATQDLWEVPDPQ